MIKITRFETMRDSSPQTSLSKLRSMFLLEEELGWQAGLFELIGLVLKEEFYSFDADEPWVLLGPKIFFNDLGDWKSSSKRGKHFYSWADGKNDEWRSEGRWSDSFLKVGWEEYMCIA